MGQILVPLQRVHRRTRRVVTVVVTELAFVAYYVRDVAAAVAFYRDVVGLTPGIEPGTSSGAAFEVDNIEAARQKLLTGGIETSEVYEFPPCHAFFASDPEGNRFMVHRRKG